MRRTALLLFAAALTAGCAPSASLSPARPPSELAIGNAVLYVEVAATPDARARGLMWRAELPSDQGMAFVFERPTTDPFWMKNTLVPLSIAFWDEQDRVVAILDMPLCGSGPCPKYEPDQPYIGAVEANLGYFRDRGIEIGDRVELAQPEASQ